MRAIPPVTLGILLFALANAGFALTDASAKWLIETVGILTFYMIAVRFLTGQASSMALGFALSGPTVWRTSALRLNLIRSAIMASTTLTNFWAVTYLDLTTTITIIFSAPFMVALAAWYFLGEQVGRHRFIAIAMGFIGVVVVIDPVGEAFHPAMLLSLGTAIAIAALSIITRFGTTTDSLGTQAFYTTLVGALICLPFFFILDSPLPQTGFQWTLFLAVGIVFGTGGHFLNVVAHRFAPAAILAPVMYTQIIWMTLGQYLIDGSLPGWNTMIGAAIVIASGLYLWYRQRLNKQAEMARQCDEGNADHHSQQRPSA